MALIQCSACHGLGRATAVCACSAWCQPSPMRWSAWGPSCLAAGCSTTVSKSGRNSGSSGPKRSAAANAMSTSRPWAARTHGRSRNGIEVEVMKRVKARGTGSCSTPRARPRERSHPRGAEKVGVGPGILRTARARPRQRGTDDLLVVLGALDQQVADRAPLLGREYTARICESIAISSGSGSGPSARPQRTSAAAGAFHNRTATGRACAAPGPMSFAARERLRVQ
jgi:hypothetical protein